MSDYPFHKFDKAYTLGIWMRNEITVYIVRLCAGT